MTMPILDILPLYAKSNLRKPNLFVFVLLFEPVFPQEVLVNVMLRSCSSFDSSFKFEQNALGLKQGQTCATIFSRSSEKFVSGPFQIMIFFFMELNR